MTKQYFDPKLYFEASTGARLDLSGKDMLELQQPGSTVGVSVDDLDPTARAWVYDPETSKVVNLTDTSREYYITSEGRKSIHPPAGQALQCDYFDLVEQVDGEWRVYQPPVDPKLVGVEHDGVMLSAMESDQNGLTAVFVDYIADPANFAETNFKFANGTEYVITKDNIMALKTAWVSFRRSFFSG